MTRLDDIVEIKQLAALNGHVLDRAEWDRLDEVYTTDAVVISPKNGHHEGIEDIRAYLSSSSATIHHSTNMYVEIDDGADEARGVTKLLGIYGNGGVITGEYDDLYKRTADGWRIHRRVSKILVDEATGQHPF